MDHALRPDPARGVFSTMLVVDGRPVELEPHLAQLRASVAALYGLELPPQAAELLADAAHGIDLGRVRLACSVGADGAAQLETAARAVDRAIVLPDDAIDLRTVPVAGWQGAHKWVDRRLLERLEAVAAPGAALLLEQDGRVLETTRANLFALGEDGVLRTPPADGSILPGTTRAQAIGIVRARGVEVREEPLTLAQLRDARELLATGSIRGVEPVRSLDGAPVGAASRGERGELATALADTLRRRWLEPAAERVRAGRV